jgi:5-methylcytosine-specific restriction endonuclease McrA
MALKKCSKCQCEKDTSVFYANKRMKDGLNTFCIECHKADNVVRKSIQRANPMFVAQERERAKEYRKPKQQQYNELTKIWRAKSVAHIQAYSKEYRSKNKELTNYLCQKRKIALLNRTPNWLTQDDFWLIEEAYELAGKRTKLFGFSWHVDHIVPLRGKTVSGLHVPNNLQVIPWLDNQRKTNTFEVLSGT